MAKIADAPLLKRGAARRTGANPVIQTKFNPRVVEQADTAVSKTAAVMRKSSTLFFRTIAEYVNSRLRARLARDECATHSLATNLRPVISVAECLLYTEKVGGANPSRGTIFTHIPRLSGFGVELGQCQ